MSDYIIEIENLNKSFKNGTRAVDNISLNINKCEIFAFLGPNGAGKTTTIRILTTLLNPTSGKVFVSGFDIEKDKYNVRKNIGVVFQDPSLDDELTAYENMEFHGMLYDMDKKLRQERIESLLKIVELWDKKDSLVKTFSGGMKRRLEIARGIMHHPKILFLDEPTTGLDPQTRNQMWNYIKNLNKNEGVTIFLTTHYLEEAEQMATRVGIIDNGKIIITGTKEEIKNVTKTNSIEQAFLELTGKEIRQESAAKFIPPFIRRR